MHFIFFFYFYLSNSQVQIRLQLGQVRFKSQVRLQLGQVRFKSQVRLQLGQVIVRLGQVRLCILFRSNQFIVMSEQIIVVSGQVTVRSDQVIKTAGPKSKALNSSLCSENKVHNPYIPKNKQYAKSLKSSRGSGDGKKCKKQPSSN